MNVPVRPVPFLEQGDHLSREEFERRYESMPGVKKAELVEGVVHMPSPTRAEHHGSPHFDLIIWLGMYKVSTPGVRGCDNCTVRLDHANEFQPDALLYIEPDCGGAIKLSDDDYLEGAPELVAEVAASTASLDLKTKLQVYCRNGVKEYLVWRVADGVMDWFILRQSQYESLSVGPDGIGKSEIFPGLWLAASALTQHNMNAVLQVLQQGLASPEHAAFVQTLQQARGQMQG